MAGSELSGSRLTAAVQAGISRASRALLRESGVDHVLTIRTILENLVQAVESNQSYAKSDTLQLLRLSRGLDGRPDSA
jgi:hypothetical protein